jgi:hypothetical protein
MLGTCAAHLDYKINLKHLKKKQRQKLATLIKKNKHTCFGKEHDFAGIHDAASFQKHVPIREYEDFSPYIHRIVSGERNVLTAEDVILLEPTGGTTSGSKLIPYTRSLKKEFQEAVNPWIFQIYKTHPRLLRGKSYWSITPSISDRRTTPSGIPVGFEEDTEYLGLLGRILRYALVVPNVINRMKNAENVRYVTAYFLLIEKDLSLISVWNPTFLLLILETIEKYLARLIADIRDGTLSLPGAEPVDFLEPYLKPYPARAGEIAEIAAESNAAAYKEIWKGLTLISCWTSGFAQYYAKKLKEYFPGVIIQGKGLIATEGIVSIPFYDEKGYFPAYTSHFFEFLEDEEGGRKVRLLHQLEVGKKYTVILTTGGGLYRYNLRDSVLVTGKYRDVPLIRFEGRENVCDIVGEKLSYGHVRRVVEAVVEKYGISVDFIMLSPALEPCGCRYILFMESKNRINDSTLRLSRGAIEEGLAENFHYRYARDLEQVAPLKIFLIESAGMRTYFNRCRAEGQKIGDIKPDVLDKRTGWQDYFKGSFFIDKFEDLQRRAR